MLFFSAALVFVALRIRHGKLRCELAFSLTATLAVLSKKSFILTVPAILLLKTWLTCRQRNVTAMVAVKESLASILWLTAVAAAAMLIILYCFRTTQFAYVGLDAFDPERLQTIVYQYVTISNSLVLAALLIILVWVYSVKRVFPGNNTRKKKSSSRQGK